MAGRTPPFPNLSHAIKTTPWRKLDGEGPQQLGESLISLIHSNAV